MSAGQLATDLWVSPIRTQVRQLVEHYPYKVVVGLAVLSPHLGLKKLDTRVAARKPDAACFLSRKKVRRNTEFLHRPPAPLRDRVRLIERWQFNLRVSTPSVRGSTSIKISYVARATKAKKYKCGN